MGKHVKDNHSIEWGKLFVKHTPGKHVGAKQPTKLNKIIQYLSKKQGTEK